MLSVLTSKPAGRDEPMGAMAMRPTKHTLASIIGLGALGVAAYAARRRGRRPRPAGVNRIVLLAFVRTPRGARPHAQPFASRVTRQVRVTRADAASEPGTAPVSYVPLALPAAAGDRGSTWPRPERSAPEPPARDQHTWDPHAQDQHTQGQQLLERIERSFREMYLNLISIIQGVAFGFLAEQVLAARTMGAGGWLAFGICFLMIVAVWQEYMVGSTTFAWTPSLLDTFVPFAIGVTEFLLIGAMTSSAAAFLTRLGIFLATGAAAYGNWLLHARSGTAFNQAAYAVLRTYVLFGTAYCLFLVAAVPALLWLGTLAGLGDVTLLAIGLTLVLPLFGHSVLNWSWRLHRIRTRL
jgi:hypothetical protein